MKVAKLIIKTESINRFFEEYGSVNMEMVRSAYHLMQDEVIVKKIKDLYIGSIVKFHIGSKSNDGRFNIEHVYLYEVYEYDTISYKLVLVDFNVVRV